MDIQSDISSKINRKYLGRRMEVIVEGRLAEDPSLLLGRMQYQAPEVDGSVYVDLKKDQKDVVKKIETFKITGCDDYDLYGECLT
jgi:ribosomal protein S12 methylthiotransferase